ncbi:uncharacterized protein BJX67DRAFT_262400 [Aspergillus lucknowensis]|uniref:Ankyrin n=1 Tax=Aspergillus lucknowensis TaxID=176173 RepID=A0ABR4LFH3_9EURO
MAPMFPTKTLVIPSSRLYQLVWTSMRRMRTGKPPSICFVKAQRAITKPWKVSECLNTFWDRGADPTIRDNNGNSALHVVAHGMSSHPAYNSVFRHVIKPASEQEKEILTSCNKDGRMPLHLYMAELDPSMAQSQATIQLLVDSGCSVYHLVRRRVSYRISRLTRAIVCHQNC